MRHVVLSVAFAGLVAVVAADPASAFDVPEGQSCGGLVCDLGLFGHKAAPKPPPDVPVVPPPPSAGAAHATALPEPVAEPRRATVHRKPRVAKTAPAPATKRPAPPAASPVTAALAPPSLAPPSLMPPNSEPSFLEPPALKPPPSTASPVSSIQMPPAPPAAPVPVPITPPNAGEAVVLANPYVYTKPLPFMFQSVDPSQAVQ